MRLTKGSEYALRGLAILASLPEGESMPLADIARAASVPPAFLAKVFRSLVRHDVLAAAPGPGHGYALARPPAAISIRQVLEAVEGPRLFEHCMLWHGHRAGIGPCLLHEHVKDVLCALGERLERLSLAEYAGRARPIALRHATV